MNSILTREVSLPALSGRTLIFAFILILLPNISFLLLAILTNTARPLVNPDYFIAAILLVISWKPAIWLAIFTFWAALLFDVLMFSMQLFPFLDLAGAWYLIKFIINAPIIYKILTIFLIVYSLIIPKLLNKVAKRTDFVSVLLASIILGILSYFTSHLQYHERDTQAILFGSNNFYYGKSQFALYQEAQNMEFLQAAKIEPVFSALEFDRAANQMIQPTSRKILLIVNESWGQPNNDTLQKAVLHNLSKKRDQFQFFKTGHFHFMGATVEGEIRELCNLKVQGFALRRTPQEQFSNCLPAQLKQQGYTTVALHGASSQMYDRFSWYPKAGFSHTYAAEQLIGKPHCQAFNGICDHALFEDVSKAFALHDKLFYYWLTLTSHANYPEEDIFNRRLNCKQYGLPNDTSLCRNFILQTQFFDDLAELVQKPGMRGVEVLVVGDHPPPTINLGEIFKYMKQGEVAWVHFKIKD